MLLAVIDRTLHHIRETLVPVTLSITLTPCTISMPLVTDTSILRDYFINTFTCTPVERARPGAAREPQSIAPGGKSAPGGSGRALAALPDIIAVRSGHLLRLVFSELNTPPHLAGYSCFIAALPEKRVNSLDLVPTWK